MVWYIHWYIGMVWYGSTVGMGFQIQIPIWYIPSASKKYINILLVSQHFIGILIVGIREVQITLESSSDVGVAHRVSGALRAAVVVVTWHRATGTVRGLKLLHLPQPTINNQSMQQRFLDT